MAHPSIGGAHGGPGGGGLKNYAQANGLNPGSTTPDKLAQHIDGDSSLSTEQKKQLKDELLATADSVRQGASGSSDSSSTSSLSNGFNTGDATADRDAMAGWMKDQGIDPNTVNQLMQLMGGLRGGTDA
ncbi:MAG: hypothetical protein KC933_20005 [Myxococcales bacterium]|nr:hypothetical protein [Myxococcales bacterium]MCB9646823.1 hypothetical protein [Deltaproteobacteria bacterium]